eukprot:5383689-Amphidinium_carterae.1
MIEHGVQIRGVRNRLRPSQVREACVGDMTESSATAAAALAQFLQVDIHIHEYDSHHQHRWICHNPDQVGSALFGLMFVRIRANDTTSLFGILPQDTRSSQNYRSLQQECVSRGITLPKGTRALFMQGALRVLDGLSPASYINDVNPKAMSKERVAEFRSRLELPSNCALVPVDNHGNDHLLHVAHALWEQDLKTGGLRNRQTPATIRSALGENADCSSGALYMLNDIADYLSIPIHACCVSEKDYSWITMGQREQCIGLMCLVYISDHEQHVDGLTWHDAVGDIPFQSLRTQCKENSLPTQRGDSFCILRGLWRASLGYSLPNVSLSCSASSHHVPPHRDKKSSIVVLRYMSWNINSWAQRRGEVIDKAEKLDLDVVFLSETQANPQDTLKIPGYTLAARHERSGVKSGGAALFVRDTLSHTLHPSICTNGTHILMADVYKSGALFHLGGIYIAPASSSVVDPPELITRYVSKALQSVHILAGDYNLSFGLNEWQGPYDDRGFSLFDMLEEQECHPLEFRGYSRITEHYRSTPDHVIVRESCEDNVTVHLAEPGSSDHLPLIVECRSQGHAPHTKTASRWRLKKADWIQYSSLLDSALARMDPLATPPLVAWDNFERAMLEAAKVTVPYGKQRKGAKAWWTDDLTQQQKRLTALQTQLNDSALDPACSVTLGREYSALRYKFQHAVTSARSLVWRSLCTGATTIDQVYSLLRSMKGTTKRPSPVGITSGSAVVYDDDERSGLLMRYFRHKSTPTVQEKAADRKSITDLRRSMTQARRHDTTPCSVFSLADLAIAIHSGA